MRQVYVYDRERKKMVPKGTETQRKQDGVYIIEDMKPYKAVCGDMAGQWITSRSKHREFVRRNGFVEVGNEWKPFFEHGGKSADNPFARRDENCGPPGLQPKGRFKRRP